MEIFKSKFIKGMMAGAVVSAAAAWWWNSESGRETRENVQDSLKDFQDFVRPRMRRFKKIGYKKFNSFLRSMILEYAEMKNLSKEKIDELMKKAQFWTPEP